jgi:hypothetical protein
LRAVGGREFLKDVPDISFDGADTDMEALADCNVTEALGN